MKHNHSFVSATIKTDIPNENIVFKREMLGTAGVYAPKLYPTDRVLVFENWVGGCPKAAIYIHSQGVVESFQNTAWSNNSEFIRKNESVKIFVEPKP